MLLRQFSVGYPLFEYYQLPFAAIDPHTASNSSSRDDFPPSSNAFSAALAECDDTPRRPVATEVEPNLHHTPGRSVRRRKRPFLGRLDSESLEIPALTGSIRDGGEH